MIKTGCSVGQPVFVGQKIRAFEGYMPIPIQVPTGNAGFGGPFKNHTMGMKGRKTGFLIACACCQEGLKQGPRDEDPPLIVPDGDAELDGSAVGVPTGIIGKREKDHAYHT